MKSKKSSNDSKKNKNYKPKSHRAATNDVRTTNVRHRQNKIKPLERKKTKEIVIRRSSGRKEKFDTNRMTQTVSRSGVPFLMARDVAKKVSTKIKKEGAYNQKSIPDHNSSSSKSKTREAKGEKTVTGSRIRNLVSNELRDRNRSDIAASYSGQVPENTLEEENLKDKQPIADSVAANRNRVLHDTSKRGGGIMT
jgi:hypothetical protein